MRCMVSVGMKAQLEKKLDDLSYSNPCEHYLVCIRDAVAQTYESSWCIEKEPNMCWFT